MATEMTTEEKLKLFDELIVVARVMSRATFNFLETIDDRFRDRIADPLADLNGVLERCPDIVPWDGTFRDEDFDVKSFRAPYQGVAEEAKGVKVTHRLTGISGQSYTRPNRAQNLETARKYVENKVREEREARGI
jgi:hypothetical protein